MQKIRAADDDIERRAQLMGHRRDELRLGAGGIEQLLVGLRQRFSLVAHLGEQHGVFHGDADLARDGLDKGSSINNVYISGWF